MDCTSVYKEETFSEQLSSHVGQEHNTPLIFSIDPSSHSEMQCDTD